MRHAIFSDIHNHTAALNTVLKHAGAQGVDGYFCLGDVGIDECVDLVRAVDAPTIFGNWEVSNWRILLPENQKWALRLPSMIKREKFWLTHAAPFWPSNLETLADLNKNLYQVPASQLFPYLHHESDALWNSIAALTEANIPLMFHGHTHRQIIWQFSGDNQLRQVTQRAVTLHPGDTFIVGVGSVGRPLDGSKKPAYVIYDDEAGSTEMVRV